LDIILQNDERLAKPSLIISAHCRAVTAIRMSTRLQPDGRCQHRVGGAEGRHDFTTPTPPSNAIPTVVGLYQALCTALLLDKTDERAMNLLSSIRDD
jgi:hypothetical protein